MKNVYFASQKFQILQNFKKFQDDQPYQKS